MGKSQTDEPVNDLVLEEEYAGKPIPHHLRRNWVSTAAIYSGMCATISWCMSGGGLISGLNFWQAIISLAIGILVLICFIYVPLGKIGAREGLNTYLIGEAAFGSKGSNIVTALVVTAIPCIAWYGIQVGLASGAIAGVFGMGPVGTGIMSVVFGIMFVIPTLFGQKGMAWLNYVSVPAMIFIILYGLYKAISIAGMAGVVAYEPAAPATLMWGINLQVGMVVVGCAFISDYTRWQKDGNGGLIASAFVGMYPFPLILTACGMIMAISAVGLGVADPWNPVSVMIALGLPAIALILIFLLQWTTCVTSIYSSSLALIKVFGGKRWVWSFVSAIVGTALAVFGFINYFMTFVTVLAAWVSPAIGVLIAEYYFVSKMKLIRKKGFYWPGLLCWLIAGLIAWKVVFFIPAINAIVIAGILYLLYHKLFAKAASAAAGEEIAQ